MTSFISHYSCGFKNKIFLFIADNTDTFPNVDRRITTNVSILKSKLRITNLERQSGGQTFDNFIVKHAYVIDMCVCKGV